MTRDEVKTVVAGVSESLKLVSSHPEFGNFSKVLVASSLQDILKGEVDEILLGDALEKVISLLDLIYEGLDREVPKRNLFDLLGTDDEVL